MKFMSWCLNIFLSAWKEWVILSKLGLWDKIENFPWNCGALMLRLICWELCITSQLPSLWHDLCISKSVDAQVPRVRWYDTVGPSMFASSQSDCNIKFSGFFLFPLYQHNSFTLGMEDLFLKFVNKWNFRLHSKILK